MCYNAQIKNALHENYAKSHVTNVRAKVRSVCAYNHDMFLSYFQKQSLKIHLNTKKRIGHEHKFFCENSILVDVY